MDEIKNLKLSIRIKQLENELFLTKKEYDETSDKYFETLTELEESLSFKSSALKNEIINRKTTEQKLSTSVKNFEELLEANHDAIFIYKNNEILYANIKAKNFLNDRDQTKKYNLLDIVHPDYYSRIKEMTDDRNSGNQNKSVYKINLLNSEGVSIPFEFSISNVVYNNIQSYLIIARDISERVEIEKRNSLNEKLFRTYFGKALVGMTISDANRNLTYVNKRFCKMLDYSKLELLEKGWEAITHPKDLEKTLKEHNSLISREKDSFSLEKSYIRKDGGVINVITSSASIIDDYDNLKYIITSIQDISEIKNINYQLEIQKNELQFSYKKLQDAQKEIIKLEREASALAVAVTASHEINQPLMIIRGNIEMLEAKLMNVENKEYLEKHVERIQGSIDTIQNILNKFQDATKLDFGDYVEDTEMAIFED